MALAVAAFPQPRLRDVPRLRGRGRGYELPSGLTSRQAAELLDPVGFAKGVLGHSLWGMQAEVMRSVVENRRTAVKSCNASGKTFLAADAVLHWITTYPDGIAVTTAPTWSHVKTVLWGNIRDAAAKSKITYPRVLSTELKLSEGNYAVGLSTNDANRFSGFHSGRVLIVVDEAPGVRQAVWDGIEGLRSGGRVSVLAIGNPVIIGGPYYDAFTTARSSWRTFTISSFDTPNLYHVGLDYNDENGKPVHVGGSKPLLEMSEEDLDRARRPYLCSRRWVKEIFEEWGPQHPYFQCRVLGEFPSQSDDTLIPLSWLERCRVRSEDAKPSKDDRPRAGLDVAGPGEANTVLVVRRGPQIQLIKSWPQSDPRGEVLSALEPYRADIEQINVDCVGQGWYLYLHLKDTYDKRVVPVNVGESALDKAKYANKKAEHFWGLRMHVQDGDVAFSPDVPRAMVEKLIGQLTVIRYRHNARGQVEIEGKDELAKRGVKSPDEAEACMLAFAATKRKTGLPQLGGASASGGMMDDLSRPSPWRMG